jgi:fimbrial chaperone protein
MHSAPRTPRWPAAFAALVLLLAGSLLPTGAGAASLQVSPTLLQLRAGQNAEGLWLSNSGTRPLQVQIRLYRWTQQDGADVLLPSDELVVSPPMQQLAAGQRQLVRIVRASDAAPTTQASYRVIVDELPTVDPGRTGMQFVLRYSVPIFVDPSPATPLQSRLQARLIDAGGMAMLEVTNSGSGYAQLADLGYAGAGTAPPPRMVRAGLIGYVLAGQTMRWPLDQPTSSFQGGTFSARVNGETQQTPLPTAPAAR